MILNNFRIGCLIFKLKIRAAALDKQTNKPSLKFKSFLFLSKNSGLWNVPFISSCYLIKKAVFPKITYADDEIDPDMAMCKNLRAQVCNEFYFVFFFHNFNKFLPNFLPLANILVRLQYRILRSFGKQWRLQSIVDESRILYVDYKPNGLGESIFASWLHRSIETESNIQATVPRCLLVPNCQRTFLWWFGQNCGNIRKMVGWFQPRWTFKRWLWGSTDSRYSHVTGSWKSFHSTSSQSNYRHFPYYPLNTGRTGESLVDVFK